MGVRVPDPPPGALDLMLSSLRQCCCRVRPWGLAAALLLIACAGARAQPGDAAVVIVFDGSGSMWGPIEGTRQSKLVVAREGVRRTLSRLPAQMRVGLTSFGHRRGDCGDVEVMRRAEPIDMDRIMFALERLNPKGRGPLTLALREAAKALPADASKRSLLLIHDDADNCQPDLCALAGELRAGGIRTHVISLAPKPEDLAKMTCLPEITGGRLFLAQNAEQAEAAIEDALRLASSAAPGPSESARPPPPKAKEESPVALPIPSDGRPGLHLRTLLAEGNEPVAWPMHWSVTRIGQSGPPAFEGRAANPYVALAAGQYRIDARDGPMAVTQTVEVVDKAPTVADVVLNAGTLRVRAQWQKSGAPIGNGVISIADAGQAAPGGKGDGKGDGKNDGRASPLLAAVRGNETTFLLPAGRYVVNVEEGLVRAQRSVVVPAGSRGRVDMALNGAVVRLAAVIRDGLGELDAPLFSIAEDDPDAPGGRREIAQSAAREAEFVVPPGTYHVSVRQAGLDGREVLAVGPGDVVRRLLTLAAGKLVLESRLAGSAQKTGEPVSYRIEQLDSAEPVIITTSRPGPELVLASGRYRVEARYAGSNVRSVREFELKGGQTLPLALEFAAANVRLRLAGSAAGQGEPFWSIRDEAGRTVWASGQLEPVAILQAGRYVLEVETQEKRYQRLVDLRAGEARLIELGND
jgi:Ca-activated chloride channel homolog